MGADIHIENGSHHARAGRLKGARLVLKSVTVTGTENLMMKPRDAGAGRRDRDRERRARARSGGPGEFPDRDGRARSSGAGTDKIVIDRREDAARHGLRSAAGSHRDRHLPAWRAPSPAVTCASRTPGPDHLDAVLGQAAARQEPDSRYAATTGSKWTCAAGDRRSVDVRTAPYPAFPDRHAGAVRRAEYGRRLASAPIIETIFENRFMHMLEMRRMGAEIRLEGNTAIIRGVQKLTAAPVMATDSARLGEPGARGPGRRGHAREIERIYHIDRGYECDRREARSNSARSIKRVLADLQGSRRLAAPRRPGRACRRVGRVAVRGFLTCCARRESCDGGKSLPPGLHGLIIESRNQIAGA